MAASEVVTVVDDAARAELDELLARARLALSALTDARDLDAARLLLLFFFDELELAELESVEFECVLLVELDGLMMTADVSVGGVPAPVVTGGALDPVPVVGAVVPVADGPVDAARMRLRISAVQMTVAPPPLPEPTHWLIVTGRATVDVDVVTVHLTRRTPPPPLPDWLHWTMSALVVEPFGLHCVVGAVPPPVPAWLHWLIVAGDDSATPVMLLSTCTVHRTVDPPLFPLPLHWVTETANELDGVDLLVHVPGVPGAP